MSSVKRGLAAVGGVIVVVGVLLVLGVTSFTVRETGDGADPDSAFSSTDMDQAMLRANVEWIDDAPGLVRAIEPSTREALATAWRRADDALERAAAGDLSGLDVWYTDAALEQALARFGSDAGGRPTTGAYSLSSAVADGHVLRGEFYSADGQIVVLSVRTTFGGSPPSSDDANSEVILVLSNGNWRVRNIERD